MKCLLGPIFLIQTVSSGLPTMEYTQQSCSILKNKKNINFYHFHGAMAYYNSTDIEHEGKNGTSAWGKI